MSSSVRTRLVVIGETSDLWCWSMKSTDLTTLFFDGSVHVPTVTFSSAYVAASHVSGPRLGIDTRCDCRIETDKSHLLGSGRVLDRARAYHAGHKRDPKDHPPRTCPPPVAADYRVLPSYLQRDLYYHWLSVQKGLARMPRNVSHRGWRTLRFVHRHL